MSTKSMEAMSALWDDEEAAPVGGEAPVEVEAAPVEEAHAPEVHEAAEVDDAPETAEEKAQRLRDEAGRFTKAPKEKPAAKVEVKPALKPGAVKPVARKPGLPAVPAAGAVAPVQAQPAVGTPEAVALKAPPGWKPTAREHWEKLPTEVKQEALRRDREAAVAMTRATEAEKQLQPWHQALAPYQALLQSSGAPPQQVVGNMLQVANTLAYGPMPHKAQALAHLIKSYGVDPGLIANVLEGQAPQGPQGQPQQPHFDPNQFAQQVQQGVLQQLQAQRQQATLQRESAQLETWADGKDFLEDVREDMADLLESAARRGRNLTLDEAYEKACLLHPEVAPVVKQREAAKQAAENAARMQKSRAAASSVRGRPAQAGTQGAQPRTRHELLTAAWEAAEGDR